MIELNPLLYTETPYYVKKIPYYIKKPLTILYKETPYYVKKPLTIFQKQIPYYIREPQTMEGKPSLIIEGDTSRINKESIQGNPVLYYIPASPDTLGMLCRAVSIPSRLGRAFVSQSG